MREHDEFPNEAVPSGPQAPIVIVQQAGRGWSSILVPPALILLAAVAILSYQIRPMTPPELIVTRGEKPPEPSVAANKSEALNLGPLVIRSSDDEAEPKPEPEPEPEPESEPEPSIAREVRNPFDIFEPMPRNEGDEEADDNDENQPAPRVEIAAVEPEPEPKPQPKPAQAPRAEIIWGDIENEARQARNRREEVERLRDDQFQQDQRRTLEKIQKAHQEASATRRHYLAELQTVIRHYGLEAAPHIAELTSRYGRDTLPEIHQAINQARVDLNASRASPEERIALLRHLGLSEPLILDDITREMEKAIGSRRGPINRNQAIVFAARKLLGTPLDRAPNFPRAAQARIQGQ